MERGIQLQTIPEEAIKCRWHFGDRGEWRKEETPLSRSKEHRSIWSFQESPAVMAPVIQLLRHLRFKPLSLLPWREGIC